MEQPHIDLHMHSRFSDDGQYTPGELVRDCASRGIKTMAITDHNCARANAEGLKAAAAAGIDYIPGIEIDCTFQGVNLHILGYGIDYLSKDFEDIEQRIQHQTRAASQKMLALTRELGFMITGEELMELSRHSYWKHSWTGEMFAEVLLDKPEYQAHPLLLPYRPGGSRSDNPYVNFYWDYYSQGKPCYTKLDYPELSQTVRIIHANHGLAILAHPAVNLKNHPDLLLPIIGTGLDGIEAYSSYHTPEQAEFYYNQTGQLGLCYTCGSDYHGKTKPAIQLGAHHCPHAYTQIKQQLQKSPHR